jgi:methyltransferase family protein
MSGSTAFLRKDMFGTRAQERERFRRTAEEWMEAGKPLRLHLGFGQHPMRDFLNLDFRFCVRENREPADFYENCFIFDWPMGLPLPDNCVDFVFHEDMFEHLTQKQQFELLAEIFRVLIPGRFHRINCPNIAYIMRAASDFSKGRAGVYDEWSRWSHVNVPTKASLEEQAKIVGYSKVHFNGKNQTVSGVWFRERRPGGQYDQAKYNIFADLEKPAEVADAGAGRSKPAWTDPATEAIIPGDEHALELVRLIEAGDTAAAAKLYEAEQDAIDYSTRDSVHVAAMQLGLALDRKDMALRHALRVNAKDRLLARNRPEWAFEVARVLDSSPEHSNEADKVRERLHEVGDRFPRIYVRMR